MSGARPSPVGHTRTRPFALSEARAARLIFVLLAAWSFSYLISVVLLKLARGGKVNGSDGPLAEDSMFYLGWVRDAKDSLLISNRWDLADSGHVFLNPMYLLSGLLARLGVGIELAYLMWKPVAVVAVFVGFAAYVRRLLPQGGPRHAALLVALFFFTPASVLVAGPPFSNSVEFQMGAVAHEASVGYLLWGYPQAAIALGLMPLFLLGAERLVEGRGGRHGRLLLGTSAAGLIVAWLHPWQALTLLLIVGGFVLWGRCSRRYAVLLVPVLATVAPVIYYWALARVDESWKQASEMNAFVEAGPWVVLFGLVPLLVFALLEYRRPPRAAGERLLLLWAPAIGGLYVGSIVVGLYPLHALEGVSLPLAILTVRGAMRFRPSPALVVAGVLVLTLPLAAYGARHISRIAGGDVPEGPASARHVFPEDEWLALQYLDRARGAGGVLAPSGIGVAVPAFTGRKSWVGAPLWSPDYGRRLREAEALFGGELGVAESRTLVRTSGARFLLSDCRDRKPLDRVLAPLLAGVTRFGCATVYELRPPR